MDTIVTLTGPTCSGKSTLAYSLTQMGIPEVKSFTTRSPRSNEIVGDPNCSYKFVDKQWIDSLDPSQLIEQVEFNGHYYGNTTGMMEEATEICGVATVVVEPKGVHHWAAAAKKFGFNHYAIYLHVPTAQLLHRAATRWINNPNSDEVYNMIRLRNTIDREIVDWPDAFPYDYVIRDQDASASEIFGFLKLTYMNH